MKTPSFTPGPWTLSAGRSIETTSGTFYLSYGKNKHGNPNFKDFVELDRNAALIAAAPDMYEVLKELKKQIGIWYPGSIPKELYQATEQANAALSKARGKL